MNGDISQSFSNSPRSNNAGRNVAFNSFITDNTLIYNTNHSHIKSKKKRKPYIVNEYL